MNDLRKLSKKDLQKKLDEIELSMLEAEGEGKSERRKSLRRSRARILTCITFLNSEAVDKNATKNN